VPVHNEAATVALTLKRALDVPYPCGVEVVVVDDGSTDATAQAIATIDDSRLVRHRHDVNRGKGAAVRTAARMATGDYVLPLDADLEYAPEDIPALLRPVLDREATVVFGVRTFHAHSAYSFWYVLGNKGVTMAANVLFNTWIQDLETCYKLLPASLYRELALRSNGFGMEAEIVGKLLRRGIRPYEVPISYSARSRAEGKKLTWTDGVAALWILMRSRIGRRPATSASVRRDGR
jgi:glycosyltransferase involved in cell wall biosynthesis